MSRTSSKKERKESKKKILKTLLNIEDELAGIKFAINAYKDLQLNDNIDNQMNDVLLGFQMTGVLEAHAEERYENRRVELDEFRGELDEYARDTEVMSRPTDSRVKSYVDRHPEYITRKSSLNEIKRKWSILKHLNKAFYMKYELLRTKAANIRKEVGDLSNAPDTSKRKTKK